MRTTIRLDQELLKRAKSRAQDSGKTLTQLIEDALRESLDRQEAVPNERVELITSGQGGLQPGIDLDDSKSLLELMADHDHATG